MEKRNGKESIPIVSQYQFVQKLERYYVPVRDWLVIRHTTNGNSSSIPPPLLLLLLPTINIGGPYDPVDDNSCDIPPATAAATTNQQEI